MDTNIRARTAATRSTRGTFNGSAPVRSTLIARGRAYQPLMAPDSGGWLVTASRISLDKPVFGLEMYGQVEISAIAFQTTSQLPLIDQACNVKPSSGVIIFE